jgi:hypothetical protein
MKTIECNNYIEQTDGNLSNKQTGTIIKYANEMMAVCARCPEIETCSNRVRENILDLLEQNDRK